jgi:hypothetical protein
MLAKHPITGAPIRIMRTETHLWKNQKTVAWLRQPPAEDASRFRRWDTLVFTPELAESWALSLGHFPSAIVLREPTAANLAWLENRAPRQRNLLFLSKALMDAYGTERLEKEKFINVICLDELGEIYPHVLRKYEPTESDTTTALSIALVYRAKRFFGVDASELDDDSQTVRYLFEAKETYNIEIGALKTPEPLWLIQQYYDPGKPKRARELKKCLEENLKNPCVDRIVLLNEENLANRLPTSPKIRQVVLGRRMTYADVIRYIYDEVPSGTLVAFANADIYLTETWNQLWSIKMRDTFLSLLRYEEPKSQEEQPQLFGPRPDSQDTWVVLSDSIKDRDWGDYKTLEFQFGRSGCDNAINVEMLRKKFVVANPCMSLMTLHCHASEYRTYNSEDVVEKPLFLYLDPTGLHDLEPKRDIKSSEKSWPLPQPFSRRVNAADEQTAKTFCAMVKREEEMPLEFDSDNFFEVATPDERLYAFENAFTTTTGLCYGYDSIYLGADPKMREAWSTQVVSHITPCIGVKSVLGVELTDGVANNTFSYLVHYLSRIFRLKDAGSPGDFWLPRTTPHLQEFLQQFAWTEQVLPVLPRDESVAAYSTSAVMLTPRAQKLAYKEDMEALRKRLRSYIPEADGERVVLVQDDIILDADTISTLETLLEQRGYQTDVVYLNRSSPAFLLKRLLGAKTVIAATGSDEMYWLLPRNATVIEAMPELGIKGRGAHMAGACSLQYWVVLVPRAKKEKQRELLVPKVLATVEEAKKPRNTTPELPVITLPTGFSGFHEHSGDSFREMVQLWKEQGKCRIEYSTTSPFVWCGQPGDVLLYDRANMDWLQQTPAEYKKLLLGNPNVNNQQFKATQWSFWPRRPRLLELRVARGLPTWEERTKTLVFYGRIENQVQRERRRNQLYTACDEFDCPIRSVDKYKYTQQEYLDQLAKSKFGLCMAGYGYKCNREVECMALGTVPVCAPDVDMDGYANPPQEGVHYIRLKSFDPEGVAAHLSEMSQEDWQRMSEACQKWWKENASAEGLWALTMALARLE